MSAVVARIAGALAEHQLSETFRARNRETGERALVARCTCGSVAPDFSRHQASVVAALPNIAIVPTSGSIEVITHAQNGDLIAREIGTSRHIAIAHIGSQPHSFANAPEALALKAEGYAALAARAAGGQA